MAIKILVVDDEPDFAVIFRQKFRRRIAAAEISFVFAENGRTALQALEADPEISLVFTDIRMPAMDGLTFLKELRALDRQVMLPIVVSAYDDMPNIREAMRQGAWDFVTKPIDLEELEQVLNASLVEIEQKLAGIRATRLLAETESQRQLAIRGREMQQEFFENVTHELRTPLTLLLSPLESALGLSSEAAVRSYLEQAKKGGLVLLDLVNQLLDFAKIDAKKLLPRITRVNVSKLVEEIAWMFDAVAAQKGVRFLKETENGVVGGTDARMLTRILLNLLSNAFKFTPKDGEVKLVLQAGQSGFAIAVSDTGPGIALSETEDGFSRFQSSSAYSQGLHVGTGLGLSICKSLVGLLDGQIHLQSQLGHGTRFDLHLPLEVAGHLEEEALETDTHGWVSIVEVLQTDPSSIELDDEKPLVLIAEDHPDMLRYIAQLLQDEFAVETATNGRLALEMAHLHLPDLIVTDWMMPEMDGLELLHRIREDRGTTHIPVVMLTAKSELEGRIAVTKEGAEAFLGKPFHPSELIAVIKNQLARRERLRERFRVEMLRPDKYHGASMEDQFLLELKQVMEKNMMNEQFGVETMADALAMSRRTLVRKLTAVTGQAPVKFIRAYRLERALQMLKDNAAPVWEIAVKTGFGSASYFTKCFKDHYGVSPKDAVHLN